MSCLNQTIPVMVHIRKLVGTITLYDEDFIVKVRAVDSHETAAALIEKESNTVLDKYREKGSTGGIGYDECFADILGGIKEENWRDVWCVLDIEPKYLKKKQWRRCTGLVMMLSSFLRDYYPGSVPFGLDWEARAEKDISEGHVFAYACFLKRDIVYNWRWDNREVRLRDAVRLLKMLYLYINPSDIEGLSLPEKEDMEPSSERELNAWIPVNEMLPNGDGINPVTNDSYVYPVTVDFGDVKDLRFYSYWRGHWYNQSPFPMDHLVTAWLPRPDVFEDENNEKVHFKPSGKTAGWRYKDKYDPAQMRCTNCGYLISSVEVEPVDTEVKKPLIKICPRCASEMKLEDRKKG